VREKVDLFTAIDSRASAARLMQPGPTPADLERILQAAGRAPDHGRLKPWRLLVLDEASRDKFARAAAAAKRVRLPSLSDEQLSAERDKLLRSPTIVIVGCAVREHAKVPEIEQISAAAAAAQNLFLAAHAMGYGVMWKTGPAAYDPGVKDAVGLRPQDHIVAIMHLGTRVGEGNGPQ
jgi:nitroreductase